MTHKHVNEGSTAWFNPVFRDQNGVAILPDTLDYRIDCKTTGHVVRVITSAVVGQPIKLTPEDNAIIHDANAHEIKVVTLVAMKGTDAFMSEHEYDVVNLSYAS